MTPLVSMELAAKDTAQLAVLQAAVDAAGDYPKQVETAKTRFKAKPKSLFKRIRGRLAEMCTGNKRCVYCEDSAADEVEHIRPKDLYPGQVFAWSNYVFACGPCNGPKNNRFAVLVGVNGPSPTWVEVTRGPRDPVTPPRRGRAALVDPRADDPLEFLWLDMRTGRYVPNADEDRPLARKRAEFTIEVLNLNARDDLVRGRRAAMSGFRSRLESYAGNGANWDAATKERFIDEFRAERYRGVWEQMKRQRATLSDIDQLLNLVPEALQW